MSRLPLDDNGNAIQANGQGLVQNVSYTGTAGQSAAVGTGTTLVRLCASTLCWYLLGANPTATTSNGSRLPADAVDFVKIQPGHKISVIRDASSGSLNITECA